jgi:hypothetical protein
LAQQVEQAIGFPVVDATPDGEVAMRKQATQITRDVTRQTATTVLQGLLRGILAERPQYRRVGVIAHSNHVEAIRGLGPPFASRIARVSYFGSGDERSSNQWYCQCDLIIVAGTPRINPNGLREYLIRIGDTAAAGEEPKWGEIRWRGQTTGGVTRIVKGRGYEHPIWRRAYESQVRATLVQSIGRGRGLLEDGADVLVLSNDPCGVRLDAKERIDPIDDTDLSLIELIDERTGKNERLTPEKHNIGILSKTGVTTAILAQLLSLSLSVTRDRASRLAERGLITRVSDRGGWAAAIEPLVASPEAPRVADSSHTSDVEVSHGRCVPGAN